MGQNSEQDQTKKEGRVLANRCFLCGKGEETIDHFLIHCPTVRVLQDLLLAIFGLVGFSCSLFGGLRFLCLVPL